MSSSSTISKSPVSNQYKIATKIKTNSSEPSDFSFFKNPSKYAISKKPTKVSKPDSNIVVPTLNASKYDVGTYFSKVKTLPPTEIKDLLENVFCPDESFEFPKYNGRKFRLSWLSSFPWLRYSPSLNGGFCLYCAIFSNGMPSKSKGLMITRPALPSAHVVNCFREHAEVTHGIHAFSIDALNSFLTNFKGNSMSIDVLIESTKVAKENELRKVLVPIIDTIIFLGHKGLPLRGHRDDSANFPSAGAYSTVPGLGNFIELLNYGIRRGDTILKDHYINHSKNASYFSQQSQNEIIECCGELISETIVKRVKEANFFTILADEAMDCLLYTSPSPRDATLSRMPSSA